VKILFLDFDGPVIPMRAIPYNIHQRDKWNEGGLIYRHWDPSATAIVKDVLDTTGAKLVISSSWRRLGLEGIVDVLELNGVSIDYLYKDWKTDTASDDTRANRILKWIEEHPDTTEWVAVDDEDLADEKAHGNAAIAPNFVHVTTENGILFEHHGRMLFKLLRDELSVGACAEEDYTSSDGKYDYKHNWMWCPEECKPLRVCWTTRPLI